MKNKNKTARFRNVQSVARKENEKRFNKIFLQWKLEIRFYSKSVFRKFVQKEFLL